MKVSFDVHAKTASELEAMAVRRLEEFGPGRMWHWDIDVEPEMSGADGEVHVWRGEVTAHD